jgi:hypothetical protein
MKRVTFTTELGPHKTTLSPKIQHMIEFKRKLKERNLDPCEGTTINAQFNREMVLVLVNYIALITGHKPRNIYRIGMNIRKSIHSREPKEFKKLWEKRKERDK